MMAFGRFIFFVFISGVLAKRGSNKSVLSDILDDLDLHSDNRIRPGYGEAPLEIHAFAFVRDIIDIEEETSTLTVSLLLMQMYRDARLGFSIGGDDVERVDEILIDNPDYVSTFWNPDTFIINEVATCARFSGSSNGDRNLANQIVRLSRNGDVLKTSRIIVTVACPMKFENFPLLSFNCDVEMESFGYKTDDIVYLWRNGSKSVEVSKIDKSSLAGRSGYLLEGVEAHSQQSYLDTGGSYSRLILRFRFKKLWLRHAITFFIPTGLTALCSLISLWTIKSNPYSGVLTNFVLAGLLVVLMGLEYFSNRIMTKVPYFTPVDFHLGTCACAVLSAIAFFSVRVCFAESNCCFCETKKKRQHSSNSTVQFVKKRYAPEATHDSEVTYYESYDVTGDRNEPEERETVSGGKGEETRDKKESRAATWILATSLEFSRWISAITFFVAEGLLWVNYGLLR